MEEDFNLVLKRKQEMEKELREAQLKKSKREEKEIIKNLPEEINLERAIRLFVDKRDLAKQFIKLQPLHYDTSKVWWLWNLVTKCWERIDDTHLLNRISNSSTANTISMKEKGEIIEALKQVGRENEPTPSKKSWVQFKDKVIDLETSEEFTATPEFFITNPIPWELGESEDTPILDNLFDDWVGEEHREELYETLAFCIVPDYFIQRIHCLIGGGANGKGTFLNVMRKFIGYDNVVATRLEKLIDGRFESAKLFKKLVCMMGETNFNTLKKTNEIKALSGNDLIGGEFKGKNPFDFENYAKLIIATNSLPITQDKTIGFYRRWKITEFNKVFDKEVDLLSNIPDEEFENLALKCLRIVKSLWADRSFKGDGNFEDRKQKYEEKSNPIKLFIETNYTRDVNSEVLYSDFYQSLINFLDERGFRTLTAVAVTQILKLEGLETKNISKKIAKGKVQINRFILGLKGGNTGNTGNTAISTQSLHKKRSENTDITDITDITKPEKLEEIEYFP